MANIVTAQELREYLKLCQLTICKLTASREYLTPDDLPQELREGSNDLIEKGVKSHRSLNDIKAQYISEILKETGGNKKRAAEILKVTFPTVLKFERKQKWSS